MSEIFIVIITALSYSLGHVASTGRWKEKYTALEMSSHTHIESLKTLLDAEILSNQNHLITIDVLKSELEYVNEYLKYYEKYYESGDN